MQALYPLTTHDVAVPQAAQVIRPVTSGLAQRAHRSPLIACLPILEWIKRTPAQQMITRENTVKRDGPDLLQEKRAKDALSELERL